MLLRLWPEKTKVSFMSLRFIALIISSAALAASAIMLTTKGLNLGIDFAGGAVIEIEQPDDISAQDIRDVVEPLIIGEGPVLTRPISLLFALNLNRPLVMRHRMTLKTGQGMR